MEEEVSWRERDFEGGEGRDQVCCLRLSVGEEKSRGYGLLLWELKDVGKGERETIVGEDMWGNEKQQRVGVKDNEERKEEREETKEKGKKRVNTSYADNRRVCPWKSSMGY